MEVYFKALRHIITLMGHTDDWKVYRLVHLCYEKDGNKFFVAQAEDERGASTFHVYGEGFEMVFSDFVLGAHFRALLTARKDEKYGEVVVDEHQPNDAFKFLKMFD